MFRVLELGAKELGFMGHTGTMEKKRETAMAIRVCIGLYRDNGKKMETTMGGLVKLSHPHGLRSFAGRKRPFRQGGA